MRVWEVITVRMVPLSTPLVFGWTIPLNTVFVEKEGGFGTCTPSSKEVVDWNHFCIKRLGTLNYSYD
jgi:hypothetical protein